MEEPRAPGMLDSLRRLGTTLLDALGTRAELAVVEFREHAERRKELVVLTIIGGAFAGLAVILATFFVIVLFWDTHRLEAIGGVTLLYLAIAAGAFLRMRAKARAMPPLFEETLQELKADRDALRGKHEA